MTGGANGSVTDTRAESLALTSGPVGGVAVTVATFSKFAVTFVFVHVYVTDAPEASIPIGREQFVESGSLTFTFMSATSPVFVTVIEKAAVPPWAIDCVPGSLEIEIPGCVTTAGGGGWIGGCGGVGGGPGDRCLSVGVALCPAFL